MKKKVHFFQSVNFKIAITFILILVIAIQIIGAYFIRELEDTTIKSFKNDIDNRLSSLVVTIGSELAKDEEQTMEATNTNIKRILDNSSYSDILEIRVVDKNGLIRGYYSEYNDTNNVGKKNDLAVLDDFSTARQFVESDEIRSLINVQPIQSPTGEATIGGLYVKSDLENKYKEISETALIFFTASLIAGGISMLVAVLVSRSITQPIGEMRGQALRIANGDYSGKIPVRGRDELGQLAETFNQLAERIEEAQETTEAERNRLNSVLTHMTDGVIATDRRGKIITINETALGLLDITNEEASGQSIIEILRLEEDYTLRSLLEDNNEMVIEWQPKNHESEPVMIRVDFSMSRRESGFITGIVAVLHDVTEQEKTERERREFVSNVSHELRTPLTSMRSYIEALQEGAWQDPEVAPDFLNVTLEETDRMIRMINDLLNLSRMDSGKGDLQLEYVNFNKLMNFILDRFDMMVNAQEKKYVIVREFTQRDLWVEIDPDKMIQVIDNIMNNAIKYSPDGGQITCRLLETHNNVILSISDQGLGIPKKDIGKVFDRFYRVDKARARAQGGTGLGLAISKEVVKAHGGNIWADSQEGEGSTFHISLPYEPYEEDWWE